MRILRFREYRTTPWKNGGGETRQIAAFPEGAGLEAFDWRVSTARVACDGPFSTFAGVDRTLAILAGAGLRLTIGERPPIALTSRTPPFAFPADLATRAELIDGPVTDLNVMVRRDAIASRITRLRIDPVRSVSLAASEVLVFCAEGGMRVEAPEGAATLAPGDAMRGVGGNAIWRLSAEKIAIAYLIEFDEAKFSGL
jgi:environmental stress-induced protein Ves